MPYSSKSQVRLFHVKEDKGELPKGTAHRWAEHTPSIKKLPERVSKKKAYKKAASIPLPKLFKRAVAASFGHSHATLPAAAIKPNPAAHIQMPQAKPLIDPTPQLPQPQTQAPVAAVQPQPAVQRQLPQPLMQVQASA